MLKKHQFWACLSIIAMVMAFVTGHMMVSGHGKKKEE